MLTNQKLHEEGQEIKSTFQVNRARMEIAAKHYNSSFSSLVEWICGVFDAKVTPSVVGLVDGFVLRVAKNGEKFVTTEENKIGNEIEIEDLGENWMPSQNVRYALLKFRYTISDGVTLTPATETTKALFYDAVAHDGLLEQCELLAHIFKTCSSFTERTILRCKLYSVKANTGRFPSLAFVDDFISGLREEFSFPTMEEVLKVEEEVPARNDNTETFPL